MRRKDFEKFYLENMDKLYRFVFFRVGADKQLAQDLVSEIFLKALEHFESYDENISKSAWLFTIAKNHLINYWRDRKPTNSLSAPENCDEEEFCSNEEFETVFRRHIDHLEREGDRIFIERLLRHLSDEEKRIVTFHYLFGYSYAEIAQILAKNETAVRVMAFRALKKLRLYV